MSGLLVVTGPPGAGKSTVATLLAESLPRPALVRGDDVFAVLGPRMVPPWLPEAHAQNAVVTDAAAAATGRFVAGGYDVVYDGVVGPWFRDAFGTAAGLAALDYVVLLPSLEDCLERVARRTGHGFTDPDATRRMHAEFATADVDRRHVVVPSGAPADVVAEVVARWGHGELTAPVREEGPP